MKILNKILAVSLSTACTIAVTSCGGGSSSNSAPTPPSPVGNVNLEIVMPSSYPSDINLGDVGMPVVIFNHGSESATNIQYSYKVNTANLASNQIPNNCNGIAAHSVCQLNIPISAALTNGAVQIQASYNMNTANKTLQAATSSLGNMTSFEQFPVSNAESANGVVLSSYDQIAARADGDNTTNMMVTAVVASANANSAGGFNRIYLADANGNKISYAQEVTGQEFSDVDFAQGRVLTFLLKVPNSIQSLQIAPKLVEASGGQETTISLGNLQKNITVIGTDNSVGNLVQSPSSFSLNQSIESQTIYVNNNGNANVTIDSVKENVSDVVIHDDTCSKGTLRPGGYCNYTVSFDSTAPVAGQANVVVTSNAFKKNDTVAFTYRGTNPQASVQLTGLNDFVTNSFSPTTTQTVTITNNGQVALTPIEPVLSNPLFTLASTTNYCYSGAALQPAQTCTFNVIYTDTQSTSGTISIPVDFTYQFGQITKTLSNSLDADYYTDDLANLVLIDPQDGDDIISFNNIINNNLESSSHLVRVYNSGTGIASNVAFSIQNDKNSLYHYSTQGIINPCTSTINPGDTCYVNSSFGPTAMATGGTTNAHLQAAYQTGTTKVISAQTDINLVGTVVNVDSANFSGAITANTFQFGQGTSSNPYQVEQGRSPLPTVTYTITNTSLVTATNVTATLNNNNWQTLSNTCSGTVGASVSCTITLQLKSTASTGSNNLDLSNLSISWADPKYPSSNMSFAGDAIYATVVPVAGITVNGSGVGFQAATDGSYLVESGTANALTFTLAGGTGLTRTVTATVVNGSGTATTTAPCSVSGSSPTCTITLNTNANNQLGNADFSVNFSSTNGPVTPATMQFHTWSGSVPNLLKDTNDGFNATNGGYVYLNTSSQEYRCSALANGKLYACYLMYSTGSRYGVNIAFNNNGYAYLGDGVYGPNNVSTVHSCQINGVGNLINCQSNNTASAPFTYSAGANGGWIYSNGSNSYMYLINRNSSIYSIMICPVNTFFQTSSCINSNVSINTPNPGGYVSGTTLYLVSSDTLYGCPINSGDGTITGCTDITPHDKTGIGKIVPSGSGHQTGALTIRDGYMYIGTGGSYAGISACPMPVISSTTCQLVAPSSYGFPSIVESDGYLYGYRYPATTNVYTFGSQGALISNGNAFGY